MKTLIPPDGSAVADPSSQSQLVLCARDLRRAIAMERERSAQLTDALSHLKTLASQLEVALAAEQDRRRELEQAQMDSLMRLMRASSFKDEETGAHIERVSLYAVELAHQLGLPQDEVQIIGAAAPMHDVGKVGLPDAIICKRGLLTPEERRQMERHTTIGADLLKGSVSPVIQAAWTIALTHHERWDGTGYPRGLRGDQIPLAGRIVMLADQYDALRSHRCYKPAFSHDRTCSILLEGDNRTCPEHFDPQLLTVFRQLEARFDGIWASQFSVAAAAAA